MDLHPTQSLLDSSRSTPLDLIELALSREFSRRVHGFQIKLLNNGLVLEGRTRSYFCKQEIQHAVCKATDLPIVANNIIVNNRTSIDLLDCDSAFDSYHLNCQ